MKYAWIEQHCDGYPVKVMCRLLGVSRSGFYAWRHRVPSVTAQHREAVAQAAETAFRRSHGVYGYRKVHDELQPRIACCRETVRSVMREKGLFSRVKRKFVVTTDSTHSQSVAYNLLNQDFHAEAPNQKWTADITYVSTREGWLYLAVIMDLFSRRIVGWSMSASLEAAMVMDALQMALTHRGVQPGLVHHSDRGSQYACHDFQQRLRDAGIRCSMSRRGNCYDNAPTESFFGKLKTEWVNGQDYPTRAAARQHVFNYIEIFYNRQRIHAALGYRTPAQFEEMFHQQAALRVA